jgi:hypothetical protein
MKGLLYTQHRCGADDSNRCNAPHIIAFSCCWLIHYSVPKINNISLSRYGTRIPVIDMLVVIFTPLQGWWNFFVYIRPRYVRCQSMYPMLSWRQRLYIVFELKDPPSKNELPAMRMIQQHARREQKKARGKEPLAKETPNAAETEISMEKISKVNLPDSENCINNLSNASRPLDALEPRRDANEDGAAAVVDTIGTLPTANEPANGDSDKHGDDDDDSDDSFHLDEY